MVERIKEIKHYGGKDAEKPAKLPYGDTYLASDTKKLYKYGIDNLPIDVSAESESQGYFGLLTDFYFGGDATETIVTESDVDTWIDVNLVINAGGAFDKRPQVMKDADVDGYDVSTQFFSLEGLTTNHFGAFRGSLSFDPDEDDGELSARLQFQRHSGTIPNDPFPIEDIVATMGQGADTDYPVESYLTFFIGDTIDTNAPGDSGKCKFQIKSSVPGTLSMRALTWYIYR
jgi:hypothetical protein